MVAYCRIQRRYQPCPYHPCTPKRPYNANQLTQMFSLDYKTVRHHLDVLRKHHVITTTGEDYGTMYFLSDSMKANFENFLEIWKQVDIPDDGKGEKIHGEE